MTMNFTQIKSSGPTAVEGEKHRGVIVGGAPENIAALKALTSFRLALIKKQKSYLRSSEVPINSYLSHSIKGDAIL